MSTHRDRTTVDDVSRGSDDPGRIGRQPLGRRFGAMLAVTGLANLGDGVLQTGAPLIAITLTRSPGEVSLLAALAWLPWLVLGIPGGVLIDRFDRRHAQIAALAVRSVLLGSAAVLTVDGRLTMPLLLVVVLLYGVTDVVSDLGQTAIVPDLVPRERFPAASGRMLAVQQVAGSFLGSPAAGFLLAAGAWSIFGVPAALAVGGALLLTLGVRGRYRHASAPVAKSNALGEVREGLSLLLRHPVLRPQLVAGSLFNMGSAAWSAVVVLWMVGEGSRMGLSPEQYALLMTGFAAGAVAGSVVAERLIAVVGEVRLLVWSLLVGALLLLVPLLAPAVVPVAVGFGVLGVAANIVNVITQSIRQRLVPRQLLGRITGAGRTVSFGLMPVGALLGGGVGEAFGVPASLLTGVVLCLAATVVLALRVRQREVDAHDLAAVQPDPASPAR